MLDNWIFYLQGPKEGWYDGISIGIAVLLVIIVTGELTAVNFVVEKQAMLSTLDILIIMNYSAVLFNLPTSLRLTSFTLCGVFDVYQQQVTTGNPCNFVV